ncbi:TetR/AcrR family transcriptional regulator [Glutamicibacter sp. NPDC087344]|uniref:TetR/AcrR family transcriptional regulator n=1 Tax=Glutamicibacter sp. NPDC087344 TaxID=3363994 RepID=UPI003806A576
MRERNRQRTRTDILVAMSLLLGQKSFDSITIEEVAKHAGVSRGTVYTYFPDGHEQLVREAYTRIGNLLDADGSARRDQQVGATARIIALATALVDIASTPEGRFYARIGTATFGPLSGVTGQASSHFKQMLLEDLRQARNDGTLPADAPVEEIAVLVSGALREIASVTAEHPEQADGLLRALRRTCNALLTEAN